jgi:hypothetical protein
MSKLFWKDFWLHVVLLWIDHLPDLNPNPLGLAMGWVGKKKTRFSSRSQKSFQKSFDIPINSISFSCQQKLILLIGTLFSTRNHLHPFSVFPD